MDGTTINGETEFRFNAADLKRNVRIQLAGGDDVVIIGGETHEEPLIEGSLASLMVTDGDEEPRLMLPGKLYINTGAGNDTVKISFVDIGGSLQIITQAGDDTVDIGRGPGFGDHEEADELVVSTIEDESDDGGGPPVDVTVGGVATINTSSGADEVKVAFTSIGSNLLVNAGCGNDYFVTGRGPIRGEHGSGELKDGVPSDESRPADTFIGSSLTVRMAGDDDFVLLRNTEVANQLSVVAGLGNNDVGTQNVMVLGTATFSSGNGDDTFALLESLFDDRVSVRTGAGNDSLYVAATEIYGQISAYFGAGNDAFVTEKADLMGGLRVLAQAGDDEVQMLKTVCDGTSTLHGGAGFDNVGSQSTEFIVAPTEVSFEEMTYDPAVLDFVVSLVEDAFEGFLQGTV